MLFDRIKTKLGVNDITGTLYRVDGLPLETLVSDYGYLMFNYDGFMEYAHRFIYYATHGELDNRMVIDHINGDRLDNRPANLRQVTKHENWMNADRSQYAILYQRGMWIARIKLAPRLGEVKYANVTLLTIPADQDSELAQQLCLAAYVVAYSIAYRKLGIPHSIAMTEAEARELLGPQRTSAVVNRIKAELSRIPAVKHDRKAKPATLAKAPWD